MSRFAAKPSLLADGSWIRKDDEEDEDIDRDPNFARSILGGRKSGDLPQSVQTEEVTSTRTTTTSVQALSRRFSSSQDDLNGSTSPSNTSYTKSSYSYLTSPTTTTTTTVTKGGKTTETTFTTSENLKSPGIVSPTMTFNERVLQASNPGQTTTKTTSKVTKKTVTPDIDAEDKLYNTLIPQSILRGASPTDSKRTITITETVKSSPDRESAEDHLFDSLTPSSTQNDYSPTDSHNSKTISSTETVTVRSSANGGYKTSRTSSAPEDDLYSTLLPTAITSLSSPTSNNMSSITKREIITVESSREVQSPVLSSPSSTRRTTSYSSYTEDLPSLRTTSYTTSTKSSNGDYDPDRTNYSYSRPDSSYEYSSINSPSSYGSSYRSSRTVLEKDLCTVCRKPFTGDAKMVLDDIKVNCHASCFKCQVCNNTLADLRAGDSLWVYRQQVQCESCFDRTRESWRR